MGKGREEEPKASQRTHGKYSGAGGDRKGSIKTRSSKMSGSRAKKGARGK
jgi:hypothetical protein